MLARPSRSGVFLRLCLLVPLCLVPLRNDGQDDNAAPPSVPATQEAGPDSPPIEQVLVPEGIFAIRLAEALNLGQTEDETQAENILGDIGIAPKKGWIAEYPVTPAVIGEIEAQVGAAADNGSLKIPKQQAIKVLAGVAMELGLNVSMDSAALSAPVEEPIESTFYKYKDKAGVVHRANEYDSIPAEYRDGVTILRRAIKKPPHTPPDEPSGSAALPDYSAIQPPEIISDYYYTKGLPLVTYYPPPDAFNYLYDWTPYPFWSVGIYFPGFFVLHDFQRHLGFGGKPYVVGRHFQGGGYRHGPAFHRYQGGFGGSSIQHSFDGGNMPPRSFGFGQRYHGPVFNPPIYNNPGRFAIFPPILSFNPPPALPKPPLNPGFSQRSGGFGGFHGGSGGFDGGSFRGDGFGGLRGGGGRH